MYEWTVKTIRGNGNTVKRLLVLETEDDVGINYLDLFFDSQLPFHFKYTVVLVLTL